MFKSNPSKFKSGNIVEYNGELYFVVDVNKEIATVVKVSKIDLFSIDLSTVKNIVRYSIEVNVRNLKLKS